ncbi:MULTISPECIES: hypothetical protein [unclassified Pseudomonas]|uniref:hypothetical protein n=1 Tax=unclassified Pseudomonas TaxID=196821 RepID=UPI0021BA8BA9|nr:MULTISPECIES: hypothetical protein [unclassified Pseudomonas]MCT8165656.1 hypothetical protein [Pseudomonas sp. HD6422]MCT8183594.1 hypothetical protein [Pseudomonas sp. HD6421]
MTIDKEKLKDLAGQSALEPKWYAAGSYGLKAVSHLHDREFIAAASPATVLALLAEIEMLNAQRLMHLRLNLSLRDRRKVWVSHCEKAEDQLLDVQHERDQLKAENEALRKDAGNWKAVLRAMEQLKSDEQGAAIWSACSRILISLASDLNSARSVVTEEGVTKDGAEIGDWRVTVERLAMAKEASHG